MHSIHWMEISTFLVFDGHDSVVNHHFSDNSIIILFHVVRYIPLNPLKPPYVHVIKLRLAISHQLTIPTITIPLIQSNP